MNGALLRLAWLGLDPDRVDRLVNELGSIEAVLARVRKGRIEVPKEALKAVNTPLADLERELGENGIRFLEREGRWPGVPRWLFVRGDFRVPTPAVAVVGSRRTSRYGKGIAREIGRRVAGAGWVVISGLAKGIDGDAHRGALEVGGLTGAVLGCGIDRWYPAGHSLLGEEILDSGGWVVSEFPPGVRPDAWRFPTRNRIIVSFSTVVIVVEAAQRSGALITARLAAEAGKDVMAVPGDLDRPTSVGANFLIRDGAHPITDLGSLVEELSFLLGPPPSLVLDSSGVAPMPVESYLDAMNLPPHQALAELSRMEAEGRIRIVDGVVMN